MEFRTGSDIEHLTEEVKKLREQINREFGVNRHN